MIRVLIAEGSPFRANLIARALQGSSLTQAVGLAGTGEEAILLAHRLKPDVIIMDVGLPALRGPLATRQIMDHAPCGILITAEPASREETAMAFLALDEGAVEILVRPAATPEEGSPGFARLLLKRVELVARARQRSVPRYPPAPLEPLRLGVKLPLVLMGGGVGAVQSGTEILRRLGPSFRGAFCMVQHLEPAFLDGYARWLAAETGFPVAVCRKERALESGRVFLAPAEAHLVVKSEDTVGPQRARAIGGHRPSITALYRSAARHRPAASCAVILSGEGRDGVEGAKLLREAGGVVLAQERGSCLVPEIPAHVIQAGVVSSELAPADIARLLSAGREAGQKQAQGA